jgi:hypothetical protein
LLLDEFYGGEEGSLTDWVLRESLPVVDMLTSKNFPLYEKLSYPMLLLFLVKGGGGGGGGHSFTHIYALSFRESYILLLVIFFSVLRNKYMFLCICL